MLYSREIYHLTEEDEKLDISSVGRTLNKNYLAKLAQHLTKETGIEWSPPGGTSFDKWSKENQRAAYFSANLGGGGRIAIRLDVHLRGQMNIQWYTETSGTAHQRTIANHRLENLTLADLKIPSKLFPLAQMKQIKDALAGSTETEEKYVLEGVNEVIAQHEVERLKSRLAEITGTVNLGGSLPYYMRLQQKNVHTVACLYCGERYGAESTFKDGCPHCGQPTYDSKG